MSSINRMYYGTKKIYPFLEGEINNDNTNCPECPECPELTSIDIVENGTYEGSFGVVNVNVPTTGGGEGGANALSALGWEDGEAAEIMDYVSSIPNDYERYVNYNSGEDGSAVDLFVKDNGQTDIIFAPFVDLDNQTSVSRMFYEQRNLIGVPAMNTSNVRDFSSTFFTCNNLKRLPNWDFSNGTSFYGCFRECGLKEIIFDAPLANSYRQLCAFANIPTIILDGTSCEDIGEFFGWYGDEMGGVNHIVIKNLKCNWDDGNGFAVCPNITYESIVEQINQLADMSNNDTKTLKIHPNTMALLSDEDKQIAINKGWILTE